MVIRSVAKPLNVQLFKQRLKEMEAVKATGKEQDFQRRIGVITTSFENCELLLFYVLRSLDRRSQFLPVLFDTINSRATRAQIIEEFLAATKPSRVTKRYQRIVEAFNEYSSLGARRDEVAHSILQSWTKDGVTASILGPAPHIARKHIGGLPRYHYDKPKLDKLIKRMEALVSELSNLHLDDARRSTKRLVERARKELLQNSRK